MRSAFFLFCLTPSVAATIARKSLKNTANARNGLYPLVKKCPCAKPHYMRLGPMAKTVTTLPRPQLHIMPCCCNEASTRHKQNQYWITREHGATLSKSTVRCLLILPQSLCHSYSYYTIGETSPEACTTPTNTHITVALLLSTHETTSLHLC